MKIYISVLFILISFSCFSQVRQEGINPLTWGFNIATSSADTSLKLLYDSDNVTKAGLTYNSTGDTIVSASNDTVVIDDYDQAVIGNSIRFTTPTSGTVYTILDTLGSGDSLKLDQNCTASIGDEFYIGCDGLIEDQSIYNNDGEQTTGAYQAKAIWIETDSSSWKGDGVDDYYTFTQINVGKIYTLSMWVNLEDVNTNILLSTGNSQNYLYFKDNNEIWHRVNNGTYISFVLSPSFFSTNTWYHLVILRNGATVSLYVDDVDKGDKTLSNNDDLTLSNLGGYAGTYVDGMIDEIKIYNKVLTEEEITELHESSKHYSE